MSFWELLVIVMVALVVIKPERLPEMTYLFGRFIGRCTAWYHQILGKIHP